MEEDPPPPPEDWGIPEAPWLAILAYVAISRPVRDPVLQNSVDRG